MNDILTRKRPYIALGATVHVGLLLLAGFADGQWIPIVVALVMAAAYLLIGWWLRGQVGALRTSQALVEARAGWDRAAKAAMKWHTENEGLRARVAGLERQREMSAELAETHLARAKTAENRLAQEVRNA